MTLKDLRKEYKDNFVALAYGFLELEKEYMNMTKHRDELMGKYLYLVPKYNKFVKKYQKANKETKDLKMHIKKMEKFLKKEGHTILIEDWRKGKL